MENEMNQSERLENGKRENVVIERANVLLVGDTVNLFANQPGASFGWGTVVNVTEEDVEIVRPFVHTEGVQCGGRLLSYIGQEITKLPRQSDRTYSVVFRSAIPFDEE
jgi:hypothetical protein